jgi:hypothetical protein
MLLYECKKKEQALPALKEEKMYIRNIQEADAIVRLARVLGRHAHAQAIKGRSLVEVVDRLFGDDPQKTEFLRAARIAINELRAR